VTKQQITSRVATVVPAADIKAKRCVTFEEAQATANAVIMGVADENIFATLAGRVVVGETAIVETGAAIDGTETRLMTDAEGRVVPWTTGMNVAGRLKKGQLATAAGQFIEMYLFVRQ
jgi:predicted lipoprotein